VARAKPRRAGGDGAGMVRFSSCFFFFALAHAAAIGRVGGDAWAVPAIAAAAVATLGLYAATHETLHRTAFGARALNDLVYRTAAPPILYLPTAQRSFHGVHHRFASDAIRDPEIALFGRPTADLFSYLLWISGLPLFFYKIVVIVVAATVPRDKRIWSHLLYYVPDHSRAKVAAEARLTLAGLGAYGAAALLWKPELLAVIAGIAAGHALIAMVTLADHNGVSPARHPDADTRTIETNKALNFILWNMPFHAEHHADPALPFHRLPHRRRRQAADPVERGYWRFHLAVLRSLARGLPYMDPPRR
jgi:fatty acid desaturase